MHHIAENITALFFKDLRSTNSQTTLPQLSVGGHGRRPEKLRPSYGIKDNRYQRCPNARGTTGHMFACPTTDTTSRVRQGVGWCRGDSRNADGWGIRLIENKKTNA